MPIKNRSKKNKSLKKNNKRTKRSKVVRRKQKKGGARSRRNLSPMSNIDRVSLLLSKPDNLSPNTLREFGLSPTPSVSPTISEELNEMMSGININNRSPTISEELNELMGSKYNSPTLSEELNELMNASPRYSDEDLLQFTPSSPVMSSTDIKPYQEFSIEESGKGLFRRGKKRSGKK